ncbi:MAG: amidohydrolase [Pseudomonadales bacterium]|nr:amidohydrolase [Pseudomonadales bacterium]MDB3909536.1 amidohydrolase [Gammaproteobacteria bacterium]
MLLKNLSRVLIANAVLLLALGGTTGSAQQADLIFAGEHIITMDGSNAAAVAVRGDRIVASGSRADVFQLNGAGTRVIELGEQALLPGFIDAHGHFSGVSRYADLLDLSSPPVGGITSVEDIVQALRLRIEQKQIPAGELVFGFGYDDSLLAEGRHPNRDDLDRASTNHPIVVRHVSGHLLAANSMALEAAGISGTTQNPDGGIIRRRAGTNEPDGVMEETAMGAFPGSGANMGPEKLSQLRREAIDIYAGYGITTIQDANISSAYADLLREEAIAEPYAVDIVAFIMANPLSDEELQAVSHDQTYTGGFRVGGVKFTLDGSPQGRTAWMSQPYTQGPPGQSADYVAYPSYSPEAYKARMPDLLARGVPVLAHANGDAAIQLMIDGIAEAVAGEDLPDHRSVAIHAQLARPDQLLRFKELGIVPSYYSVHPYFWGDWHRLSFGEERASFISPVKATVELGITYTVHNDSPVVPPDIMRLISITVNRQTRSGYVLGPDQRASVVEAIYAVTQGAAYQYFEEDEKGSITVGKRADFVILEQNPLLVDPQELGDIAIVETFSRGASVFRR